jgi:hypothetical protein
MSAARASKGMQRKETIPGPDDIERFHSFGKHKGAQSMGARTNGPESSVRLEEAHFVIPAQGNQTLHGSDRRRWPERGSEMGRETRFAVRMPPEPVSACLGGVGAVQYNRSFLEGRARFFKQ